MLARLFLTTFRLTVDERKVIVPVHFSLCLHNETPGYYALMIKHCRKVAYNYLGKVLLGCGARAGNDARPACCFLVELLS